jgi:hypothetical protein
MCKFIESPHVMPGWVCCFCRTYNGLQRFECRGCDARRHEIEIPAAVIRCRECGFGWPSGQNVTGECPSCVRDGELARLRGAIN